MLFHLSIKFNECSFQFMHAISLYLCVCVWIFPCQDLHRKQPITIAHFAQPKMIRERNYSHLIKSINCKWNSYSNLSNGAMIARKSGIYEYTMQCQKSIRSHYSNYTYTQNSDVFNSVTDSHPSSNWGSESIIGKSNEKPF